MKRPFLFLAAALLAGAVAACDDDSTRPLVETSSISVRAYVDADGSGAFDAGDIALSGTSVTLTDAAGTTLSATTDAQGVALFEDVAPGSYRVAFGGTAPAGAVLATATAPVIAAPSFGGTFATEFRFVLNPGSVSGRLFRDNNGNDAFDAGDTPAPGIPVAIFAGSAATGEPVAQTTTDEQGSFTFTSLRPGTYTLSFTPFPTMTLVGGNAQTVMVAAEAVAAAPVEFTGNLLSPIADVRAAAAAGQRTIMAVRGVVTWQPPFSDELFIEDETGGILVFAQAADVRDLGLEAGDTVLVVGETQNRFGELQLTNVSTLMMQSSGAAPEPLVTLAAELNAGQHQHELVQVRGATVTDIDVLTFNNQFVTLRDRAGNEFGVYADSRTGVLPERWTVGGVYDVTGVPGFDNRFAFHHRIEVRGTQDVVAGDAPSTTADARAAAAGTVMTVRGVVIWQPVRPTGASFNDELFIQDATGGLQVFAAASGVRTLGLQPGDVVLVTGETEDRFGERQLTRTSAVVQVGEQAPPAPVDITAAQLASGERIHQLVRIQNAVVVSVETLTFDNHLVTLRAPDGTEFGVYVDSRVGVLPAAWTVGSTVSVTGVVNFDNRYAPHLYRIWIRSAADVTGS